MTWTKRFAPIIAIVLLMAASLLCASGCSKLGFSKSSQADGGTALEVNDNVADKGSSSKDGSSAKTSSTNASNVVMTIRGDKDTYVLAGEEYIESGCQAIDKKAGPLSDAVKIESDVDTSTPGDYEVVYTLDGKDEGSFTATRTVHVVDSFEKKASKVPVLMYHYVYSKDDAPANLNANYLLDTKLAEQCKYLKDNDYYFPSFQELRAWVDGSHTLPAKSVILTFDDGQSGFFKYGVPVLEEYEVPATSFVIGSKAAKRVKKYASPYIQYQSHSYNMHRAGGGDIGRGGIIYTYSEQDVKDDIASSNKVTGDAVAFAYPFGDNDEKARRALKDSGILCAFTIVNDKISVGDDPMALNRVRISGDYSTESYKYLVSPNN